MAALPSYGVDPGTQQPMPMPNPGVDPNSPPADPNLDPYAGDPSETEAPTRERVELCVLLAIESCAKAVEAGKGADNPDFVAKYASAAQSLGLAYQALAGAEQKEGESGSPSPGVGQPPAQSQ